MTAKFFPACGVTVFGLVVIRILFTVLSKTWRPVPSYNA